MNRERFDELLAKLLEGAAGDEEMEALARAAAADDQLRAALLSQLRIDEGVRLLCEEQGARPSFAEKVATRVKAEGDRFEFLNRVLDQTETRSQRTLFRRVTTVAGLLACTAALVLIAVVIHTRRQPEANLAEQATARTEKTPAEAEAEPMPVDSGVAVVKRLVGVEWSKSARLQVGDLLRVGFRLRQQAGTTQVQFYRGAVVTLEGPAELEIIGVNDARLHSGKAWAHVPELAQGFTLLTPDIDVVDLGTEFGVEVHPGLRTEVSVFSGEVELYKPQSERRQQSPIALKTGEGLAFGAGEALVIEVDRTRFSSTEQLRQQQRQQASDNFEHWRQWSAATKQDPRVLLYYTFDARDEESTKLANEAAGATTAAGHVVGGQWAEGRWPGKSALDFKRPSDRVRFQLDGEYDAVTLAAWVRIDGLDRPLCSLMLTDGFDAGEVHWQINSKGELGLAIGEACNLYSTSLVNLADLGKWMHVASTYDRATRQVHQYFNGELVQQFEVATPVATRFGEAEIANWSRPISEPPFQIRNFNGRMDEFLVYRAALTGEEIRAMYEAGKPN